MAAGYKSLLGFWCGGAGSVQAGFSSMFMFWFGGVGVGTGGTIPYHTIQGSSGLPAGFRTLQGTRR